MFLKDYLILQKNTEVFYEINGDSPLINYKIIDEAIKFIKKEN